MGDMTSVTIIARTCRASQQTTVSERLIRMNVVGSRETESSFQPMKRPAQLTWVKLEFAVESVVVAERKCS